MRKIPGSGCRVRGPVATTVYANNNETPRYPNLVFLSGIANVWIMDQA